MSAVGTLCSVLYTITSPASSAAGVYGNWHPLYINSFPSGHQPLLAIVAGEHPFERHELTIGPAQESISVDQHGHGSRGRLTLPVGVDVLGVSECVGRGLQCCWWFRGDQHLLEDVHLLGQCLVAM